MKKCPFCGASLPEEASFCPFCAKSINRRAEAIPPKRYIYAKFIKRILFLLPIIIIAAGLYLYFSPDTYEGKGEVLYSDSEGSYQLLTNYIFDRYTPLPSFDTAAGAEESYRFPSYLYVNSMDTGEDASGIFMQRVASAKVEIIQPEDSKSPVKCSKPEEMRDINPGAALVSLIDFTRESKTPAEIVWVLDMKNGDTIKLSMELIVTPTKIFDYTPENSDMSDTAALQKLLDDAAALADERDTINVYLPPVTYTEPLVLPTHSVNLIGADENGKRTTFTEGMRMSIPERSYFITYITGIDFVGDGTGVGLSSAGRIWTKECRFFNWKTALLGYGSVWINTTDCTFENNGIGLHYNSTDPEVSASDTHFTGNIFTDNDTAVLLENVPSDITMNFGECVFTGNGTDIDNVCRQSVDISEAIFQ